MNRDKNYFVVWVTWRLSLALDNKLTRASGTCRYLDVKVVWFFSEWCFGNQWVGRDLWIRRRRKHKIKRKQGGDKICRKSSLPAPPAHESGEESCEAHLWQKKQQQLTAQPNPCLSPPSLAPGADCDHKYRYFSVLLRHDIIWHYLQNSS